MVYSGVSDAVHPPSLEGWYVLDGGDFHHGLVKMRHATRNNSHVHGFRIFAARMSSYQMEPNIMVWFCYQRLCYRTENIKRRLLMQMTRMKQFHT